MSQTAALIDALKRQLKMAGLTYAHVAAHLGLSEASVKRQFSRQSFDLKTLEAVCGLAGLELYELAAAAEQAQRPLHCLSEAQERELVAEPKLALAAVCALNHWTLERIVATYRLSEAECVGLLLRLDRLGMIQLMPGNRIRLRIARDFTWLPGGPIQRFFRDRIQTDFLSADFEQDGELLRFQHAMLTPEAARRLQQRLSRLLREFSELHEECKDAAPETRHGTSLLLALRSWEPAAFATLRR